MTTTPIVLNPTADISFKIDVDALDQLVKNHIDKYVYREINNHVNAMAKRYINAEIEDAVRKNISSIIANCIDEYTKATKLNDQFYSEMNYKFATYIQNNQSTIFAKIIIQTYTEYLNKNPNIVKDLVASFINSDSFQIIAKTMFYKRLISRFNSYTVKVTDKLLKTLLTKPENQKLINDILQDYTQSF